MAPELTADQMLQSSQHLRDQLAASLSRLDSYIELLKEERSHETAKEARKP